MNKETQLINDHIKQSGYCLDKIDKIRKQHSNFKDFNVMLGYLVMEIVNEEQKLIKLSRKNIDLQKLSELYF